MEDSTPAAEKLPFVSVVIPALNEEAYLPACLESLVDQDYAGRYEIIVVDNDSTDDTAAIARRWGVRVVNEAKQSPACARQKGAESASGEILLFLDADTQAPHHWISTFVARFLRDPGLVSLTGPYVFNDGSRVTRFLSYGLSFVCICLDQGFRKVVGKGGALWGSSFAVRRTALISAGGFDTNIRFYGEEYELSLRLRKTGSSGILPGLFVRTSARRVRKLGAVTQYWNWIIDYFSVLFWNTQIPGNLEDLPGRASRAIDAFVEGKTFRYGLTAVAALAGLFWLHASAVDGMGEGLLFLAEAGVLGAFITFHTVNPRSGFFGETWSKGTGSKRRIALTFDDGPNEPFTSGVLDILKEKDIRATFFLVGENVRRYPEVCRRIAEEGHAIGNHSFHHKRSLCLKSGGAQEKEIESARKLIAETTGITATLFRPPHGFRTPWMMKTLRRLGYTVVTWNNMTDDWEAGRPSSQIISKITAGAVPGGIIVLHDGRSTRRGYDRGMMLKALPEIIKSLERQGYTFVTVPEMIAENPPGRDGGEG